jgi:hypothetical protein
MVNNNQLLDTLYDKITDTSTSNTDCTQIIKLITLILSKEASNLNHNNINNSNEYSSNIDRKCLKKDYDKSDGDGSHSCTHFRNETENISGKGSHKGSNKNSNNGNGKSDGKGSRSCTHFRNETGNISGKGSHKGSNKNSSNGNGKSDGNNSIKYCLYSKNCNRHDCWFYHPFGRYID